jgi:thiamine-phosphate pyrophosphorylase
MLVTDRHDTDGRDLVQVAAAAARGGVRLIQVRERDLPDPDLLALVTALRAAVPPDVVLLVNGRPEVARQAGVGLHLAATAAPPGEPHPRPYGRAAHDAAEIERALTEPLSYLLVGPVFPTSSKPGHPGAGLDLVTRACGLAGPVPVYAIGGIVPPRVEAVLRAGAHGVAVRSALLRALDPRAAARALGEAIRRAEATRPRRRAAAEP